MHTIGVYLQVGFQHIVSLEAADHILFLLVLAAIYRGRDWRTALGVISAFTVGHSITLALAATHTVLFPTRVIEFLIPVTIAATGIENLWHRHRTTTGRVWIRPLLAGLFGLVHGAGFAGYLESLFLQDITLPLLGFNMGIELGQIVVLAAAALTFGAIDSLLRHWPRIRDPFQARLVAVSALISVSASAMALERWP
jgi:hypothetical protein